MGRESENGGGGGYMAHQGYMKSREAYGEVDRLMLCYATARLAPILPQATRTILQKNA